MNRRKFIAGSAAVSVLLNNGSVLKGSLNKPNFIFMLSDDQNWEGLSVKMDPEIENSKSSFIETPNIERLALQGMRFTQAYSPSPVCSPASLCSQGLPVSG